MTKLVAWIWQRAIIVFGVGAVLVSLSEYWFYEVGAEVDNALILIAYGLLGYLFTAVLQRFRVTSLAGLVVAAALLGFLIEGVPVPVVYANPPISIIWTSLAWHALITIGLGWFLVRFVLADRHFWRAVVLNSGLGIALGLWNAFMWNAYEAEEAGELVFVWKPLDMFAPQFLYGYVLFVGGHVLLDRFYPRDLKTHWPEHIGLWILAAVLSVLVAYGSGLLILYPILPALVLVCLLALRKEAETQTHPQGTIMDHLYQTRVPLWRFSITLLIPACALPVYGGLVALQLETEMNVLLIMTAGPATVAALLWSLAKIAKRPKVARENRDI